MLQATLYSRDELHYTHVIEKGNKFCHCATALRFFLVYYIFFF